jgi:hypothetical protein
VTYDVNGDVTNVVQGHQNPAAHWVIVQKLIALAMIR